MSTSARIRERLAQLQPSRLEIIDDSAKHIGHAGAREGGHYQVVIEAACFTGQTQLSRHRMIYALLGDLMRGEIHALAIDARIPER